MVVSKDPSNDEKEADAYGADLESWGRSEVFETTTVEAVARHRGRENCDGDIVIKLVGCFQCSSVVKTKALVQTPDSEIHRYRLCFVFFSHQILLSMSTFCFCWWLSHFKFQVVCCVLLSFVSHLQVQIVGLSLVLTETSNN